MTPDLTEKIDEWKKQESIPQKLHILEKFPRLPCKWIRPLRDVFVTCWNKDKVRQIIDDDVGTLRIADREYCRGEVEDVPDCWEGLKQSCIDKCIHYFKGTSRYTRLTGFCTKQCKNFELFKQEVKFERTKVIDLKPKQVTKIGYKSPKRIREIGI